MDPGGWSDTVKGSQTKEDRWPLDAEEGREMDSPLKPPDRGKIHENEKA